MLVHFVAIWSILRPFVKILWQFGIFYGHLVYFSPFWYVVPRKIWQPCTWGTEIDPAEKTVSMQEGNLLSGGKILRGNKTDLQAKTSVFKDGGGIC
jgi:hypothetical protein